MVKRIVQLSLITWLWMAGGISLLQAQENVVRLNVVPLFYKNIGVSYEHVLSDILSINGSLNLQLPLEFEEGYRGEIIEDLNEEWEQGEFRDGVEWRGFDLTPELRIYTGREAPTGFFFSVLLRYSNYNMSLPYHYIDDNVLSFEFEGDRFVIQNVEVDVDTDINIQGLTAGIGIGGQWIVGNGITLGADLALGWGFGWGDGEMEILTESIDIPNFDQEDLIPEELVLLLLDEIGQNIVIDIEEGLEEEDYPLSSMIDIDLDSNDNFITADGNFPWAIIRLGITVGFAF